jgi:primosomal protein N' (replication factor Y)
MKSKISLILIGYSPSAEVARLIENKWIEFNSTKNWLKIQSFAPAQSELLPSRLISEIRKAMKVGPILFISPRKGYSQALTCSKCRNIALCTCGGKLSQASAKSSIECVICAKVHSDWRCTWCQNSTPFLMGRGSERFAYEIGAAFPGTQITQSASDSILDSYNDNSGFVIATPGAAPIAKNGYAMIVILEGDRFFTQTDIRAHERSRELFFSASALGAVGATIALVMAADHPIIGALASWKPALVSQRELREREREKLQYCY